MKRANWFNIGPEEKMLSFRRYFSVVAGIFAVTALSGAGFLALQSATLVSAETVSVTVDSSNPGYYIDMTTLTDSYSGSDKNVIGLHPNVSQDGAYKSAKDTVTVSTNSPSGYMLFLSTNDATANSNRLYLDGDNTSTSYVGPINSTSGATTLGDNTWGYALPQDANNALSNVFDAESAYNATPDTTTGHNNEYTPAATAKYKAVPVKGNEEKIRDTATAATNQVTTIYYGAKVNMTLPAGTYSGTVTYSSVIDASNGGVINNTDIASVAPSEVAPGTNNLVITTALNTLMAVADASNPVAVTLSNGSNTYTCTVTDTTGRTTAGNVQIACTTPSNLPVNANPYTVTVNIPKFGKTYTMEGVNGLIVKQNGIASITKMQEMTSDICAATDTPSATDTTVPEAVLQDTRDNKYYTVRKLADGNCWMAQNLDLELSTSKTLTPSDTNITSNWTPTENTYAGSTSSTYWTTSNVASGMSSWTYNDWSIVKSYSYSPNQSGDAYVSGGRTNGNTPTGSLTTWSGSFPSTITPTPTHLAGNYYSFPAATAGTGAAVKGTDNNAAGSICPKGWKLPPNTGNSSFYTLLKAYGILLYEDGYTNSSDAATILSSEKILTAPLSFVRSGYLYGNGILDNRGTFGLWWSSTGYSSDSNHARLFGTVSGRVIPQDWDYVGCGYSVRCVAQ